MLLINYIYVDLILYVLILLLFFLPYTQLHLQLNRFMIVSSYSDTNSRDVFETLAP